MRKNRQKASAVGNARLGVLFTGGIPSGGKERAFFWERFKKWMTSRGEYSVSPETVPDDADGGFKVALSGKSRIPVELEFELGELAYMTFNEFEARLLDKMREASQREFNETFKL